MSGFKISVLGGGVIGITTAIELKREFPNSSITLYTDQKIHELTSYVAAGIFIPSDGDFGTTKEISRKWIEDSYYYWKDIAESPYAETAGVKELSGYVYSSLHPHVVRNEYLEKLLPVYRPLDYEELQLCPGGWKYGSYLQTYLTDPSRYLYWAYDKTKQLDVKIKYEKVNSFKDLGSDNDMVFNCTGLGAKFLCNDTSIVPIRGQVAKVHAPWVKNFYFGEYSTYIIPSFDNITLGGCRQYESYSREYNHFDYLSIRDRCDSMLPSLKDSKVLEHRVGLRPHRVPCRVEKEYLNVGGKQMKIIHNYGHGGYGVTTCPGTVLASIQLMREMIVSKSKL